VCHGATAHRTTEVCSSKPNLRAVAPPVVVVVAAVHTRAETDHRFHHDLKTRTTLRGTQSSVGNNQRCNWLMADAGALDKENWLRFEAVLKKMKMNKRGKISCVNVRNRTKVWLFIL